MTDYLLSMTGYGEATIQIGEKQWQVVVQSVNSRYLDCRFRLPHAFQSLELQFRSKVKKYVEHMTNDDNEKVRVAAFKAMRALSNHQL